MSLLSLPPEVLSIILRHLQAVSVRNLYNTCKLLRNFIGQGLIKELTFPYNSAKILKTHFVKDISPHVKVLTLSGVTLDIPFFIKVLKNMKCLTDLDVRKTNVILPDFLEIVKVTSLESIAINFSFNQNDLKWKISETQMMQYQNAFEGFKNVHFDGKLLTLYKKMAECMLLKANLQNLYFTCFGTINTDENNWYGGDIRKFWDIKPLKFSKFHVHFTEDFNRAGMELPIFKMDINKYEYFIFGFDCAMDTQRMAGTPLVKKLISDNINVEIDCFTDVNPFISRDSNSEFQNRFWSWMYSDHLQMEEIIVICWDKEHINFDSVFNLKLLGLVKGLRDKYRNSNGFFQSSLWGNPCDCDCGFDRD